MSTRHTSQPTPDAVTPLTDPIDQLVDGLRDDLSPLLGSPGGGAGHECKGSKFECDDYRCTGKHNCRRKFDCNQRFDDDENPPSGCNNIVACDGGVDFDCKRNKFSCHNVFNG